MFNAETSNASTLLYKNPWKKNTNHHVDNPPLENVTEINRTSRDRNYISWANFNYIKMYPEVYLEPFCVHDMWKHEAYSFTNKYYSWMKSTWGLLRNKLSTTEESAMVVTSPIFLSFFATCLSTRRMILPERVFGSPGEFWMTSGVAKGPILERTKKKCYNKKNVSVVLNELHVIKIYHNILKP